MTIIVWMGQHRTYTYTGGTRYEYPYPYSTLVALFSGETSTREWSASYSVRVQQCSAAYNFSPQHYCLQVKSTTYNNSNAAKLASRQAGKWTVLFRRYSAGGVPFFFRFILNRMKEARRKNGHEKQKNPSDCPKFPSEMTVGIDSHSKSYILPSSPPHLHLAPSTLQAEAQGSGMDTANGGQSSVAHDVFVPGRVRAVL